MDITIKKKIEQVDKKFNSTLSAELKFYKCLDIMLVKKFRNIDRNRIHLIKNSALGRFCRKMQNYYIH